MTEGDSVEGGAHMSETASSALLSALAVTFRWSARLIICLSRKTASRPAAPLSVTRGGVLTEEPSNECA
jgi:hypothetical protein